MWTKRQRKKNVLNDYMDKQKKTTNKNQITFFLDKQTERRRERRKTKNSFLRESGQLMLIFSALISGHLQFDIDSVPENTLHVSHEWQSTCFRKYIYISMNFILRMTFQIEFAEYVSDKWARTQFRIFFFLLEKKKIVSTQAGKHHSRTQFFLFYMRDSGYRISTHHTKFVSNTHVRKNVLFFFFSSFRSFLEWQTRKL